MGFDDIAALPEAELLAAGGRHPVYARLLRVEVAGDEALLLVDTNGYGVLAEAEVLVARPRRLGLPRCLRDRLRLLRFPRRRVVDRRPATGRTFVRLKRDDGIR